MRSDEKPHIKMKGKKLPVELMLAIDHVTQCLEDWSSLVPKPSHSDLKREWKGSMKEYLETLDDDQGNMVESISLGLIEAFDEWEGDEYQEAVEHEKTFALMQRPQTTQRTTDWYTEFKRCLTASEIYKAFGTPRERGLLVLQKAGKIELSGRGSQSAVVRSNMSPFDWGICFEPVVK